MDNRINEIATAVTNCDTWSQLSVFGSWQFIVNSQCIQKALRYIPDAPVNDGIHEYTEYEAARRKAQADLEQDAAQGDFRHELPAFLALQREIEGLIYEADGESRTISDTFEFISESGPDRNRFRADYDERVRLGMKPGLTKRQFVEYEYERACNQHNQLVAKGEDAVRLCDSVRPHADRGFGDLPDWVAETLLSKAVEKLHNRWEKLELTRTNPRRTKQVRDSAEADQMLIKQALNQFGEEPGFTVDEDDSEE